MELDSASLLEVSMESVYNVDWGSSCTFKLLCSLNFYISQKSRYQFICDKPILVNNNLPLDLSVRL